MQLPLFRCLVLAGIFLIVGFLASESCWGWVAQTVETENLTQPAGDAAEAPTILRMLFGGNLLGVGVVLLIIVLSMVSLFFIVENLRRISAKKLMPDKVLSELEGLIVHGEITRAIEMCRIKANYSMSTEIILAGLQRFESSEFGYAEYRSAVEEAGEDQTGRLYRRIEVLNVIGAIAPMLGLTGTVIGMIEAFTTRNWPVESGRR